MDYYGHNNWDIVILGYFGNMNMEMDYPMEILWGILVCYGDIMGIFTDMDIMKMDYHGEYSWKIHGMTYYGDKGLAQTPLARSFVCVH